MEPNQFQIPSIFQEEGYLIIVDLTTVENIDEWERKSIELGVAPTIDHAKKEAYIKVFREGSSDFGKLAEWLKANGEIIKYEGINGAKGSDDSIVALHELFTLTKMFQFGWKEFKLLFVKDTHKKYKKYLKLSLNGIEIVDKHEPKHTFSSQLFDSIGRVKKIQDTDTITFYYNSSSREFMFYVGGALFDISTPPPLIAM
ncbi:hypothetical protein HNP38_000007 [Chryseobacterium defluvii]|uniref:Uncharacterized protein n=1 Tax=Chryseobacterium defluvii TaxID=160396 RepID=A0A840K8K3_9FLAO|nr:hypothetical protein [Chryseobacterium defluvii]MBB4804735.1 hypothetical protein [Chryseobacterium defluvii]